MLWKKVMPRLSAGRVQSVATRVIVDRERNRMVFVPAEYWDLAAEFTAPASAGTASQGSSTSTDGGDDRKFAGRLSRVNGKRVAAGRDFNDRGELTSDAVVVTKAQAEQLATQLQHVTLPVINVEEKPYTRKPSAPFMTSTLQQEAGRKLHYTSERTMRVAQRLYENGHITYMRTDSTTLSEQGLQAARQQAIALFGKDHVADAPRRYDRKVKNSQEAHEAIRPAGEQFSTPAELRSQLDAEEYKLYELIWQRTIASQMADVKGVSMKVTIGNEDVEFTTTGRTVTFAGFLRAYSDAIADAAASSDANQSRLPHLKVGDEVAISDVAADEHTTNPPARYTEASLVKKMEDLGIGRPSTYASIIKTIQDRGYVYSRGNALVPSWVAFAVVGLMEKSFAALVDYDFTSSMEDELDDIAAGNEVGANWLKGFYFGDEHASDATAETIARQGGLKALVGNNLEQIDARVVNSLPLFDDDQGRPIYVRVGRYGPYLERQIGVKPDGEPEFQRANLSDTTTPDELTLEFAEKLFATPQSGRELGVNPANGRVIVVKEGRFGPYVTEIMGADEKEKVAVSAEQIVAEERAAEDAQRAAEGKRAKNWETKTAIAAKEKRINQIIEETLKPATASLFSSMDPSTVTLEEALQLISLPREVGVDPTDGQMITAQNGRYGPYLKKGTDSRSLSSEEQIFTITLDEARRIYAEPKRRGRGATTQQAIKELGDNDVSGKPMSVKDGRFGPYVTDGETNASLRKGDDPLTLTDARANELLSERRAKEAADGGSKKKATKKTAAKKKTTTKKAVKKPTKTTKRVVKAGSRSK